MKKIAVLGHFALGAKFLDGQTVKTHNLYNGLTKHSDAMVIRIDTHGWTRHPFKLVSEIKKAFRECDVVIMLPAHNGVKVFAPVLLHYKKKYSKKIFYDVIGGWLPEFLQDKAKLRKTIQSFDGVWVETSTMMRKLEEQGLTNVVVVPNFKDITPLTEKELIYPEGLPLRLCTFSRVMKEKGIETAVDVIDSINRSLGSTVFSFDIYGPIAEEDKEWFSTLEKRLPSCVSYKGCIDSSESVNALKHYTALLFPTHFYTEGIPGTIIDAYAAGIPVISARWESFSDVVDDRITGLGYEFDDKEALKTVLLNVTENSRILLDMKKDCLSKANDYACQGVMKKIIHLL